MINNIMNMFVHLDSEFVCLLINEHFHLDKSEVQ